MKKCESCNVEAVISTCCKECSKCEVCFGIYVSEVIFNIEHTICQHSEDWVCRSLWGYSCKGLKEEDLNKLLCYRGALKRYSTAIRGGYKPCLCPEEVQMIFEASDEMLHKKVCTDFDCDVEVDNSKEEKWQSKNPLCIIHEPWEKPKNKIFPKPVPSTTVIKDPLFVVPEAWEDTLYETCPILQPTAKHIKSPKVLFSLAIYEIVCEHNITVSVTEKECAATFKVITKDLGCPISLEVYTKLIECKLSPSIIVNLAGCGYKFDYDKNKKVPILIREGLKIPFDGLNIKAISNNISKITSQLEVEDINAIIKQYSNPTLIEKYCD